MKEKISDIIVKALGKKVEADISVPEEENFGHYSTNLALRFAKTEGRKPLDLAKELAEKIVRSAPADFFEKVEAVTPGFINFWLSAAALQKEFGEVRENSENYGRSDFGKNKTVIVEYSQPNIAKKMHVGHLRTTIIGDALANIFDFLGYKVVRWNYLGDWGTQFGKLIAAYKLWGDKKAVEANPVDELQRLYVKFHDELKNDPELEKRGQEEFRKLEEGDEENRKLWEWFKGESLKEFEETYKTLGVKFDVDIAESFYEEDVRKLIARLKKDDIAKISEGALVITLDEFELPPALVQKADGASLYLTRDIANLEYRLEKYNPEKILYVVGNEQSLHFEQLFAVAKILRLDKAVRPGSPQAEFVHVKYGLVLGEAGKKLATREGRTILLEEVIEKAISLSREIVAKKAISRKDGAELLSEGEMDNIAKAVGIGALKYNDLKENRTTDIIFDWKTMLDFSGDSAPYLQYTYARLKSIIRKSQIAPKQSKFATGQASRKSHDIKLLNKEIELALMRNIFEFPDEILRSGEILQTSGLANYLYKLAVLANKFYETTPVLKEENESRRAALLVLLGITAAVLKSGLGLLGIRTLEEI